MEKTNNEKTTFYALIISNVLHSVISLFASTFLIAYLFQTSGVNPFANIAIYHMVTYFIMMFLFPLLGNIVKKTHRVWIFRIGIIIKCVFIMLICLLKDNITNYIFVIATLNGIGESFYWSGYNVLKNEAIENNKLVKWTSYNSIINRFINLIVPIVLGSVIEYSSFLSLSFYVLGLGVAQFVVSFFISNPNAIIEPFYFRRFIKIIKRPENKPLRTTYFVIFLTGLKAVIGTLTTVLIMMTFNSNMSLGILSSIFTLFTIVIVFLFMKYYNPKNSKWTLIICSILPILAVMGLFINVNKTTFVIFNLVYSLCMVAPEFIADMCRSKTIRDLSLHRYITEHQSVSEIFVNIARVSIYAILFVVGIINNIVVLEIFLLLCLLSVPLISYVCYKMELDLDNRTHQTQLKMPLGDIKINDENSYYMPIPDDNEYEDEIKQLQSQVRNEKEDKDIHWHNLITDSIKFKSGAHTNHNMIPIMLKDQNSENNKKEKKTKKTK